MKIYLETYGCSANQSDSEIILGILSRKYEIVDSPKKSDVNIINTCIVKSPTENRMKFRIKELLGLGKPLIIAGCMPKAEIDVVKKIAPEASFIGPNSIHEISKVVKNSIKGKRTVLLDDIRKPKICLPKVRKNPIIDIVQISTGCLGNCYYCQTKLAKGKLFSYPKKMIIKQIKNSLNEGVKEFWLTSQDTGCYGFDIGENLPKLLEEIVKIRGKFFVRIGMMNPNHALGIYEQLIKLYSSEKIFKFIHIPVQSGSDRILKKMNRKYSSRDFKKIIKDFRKEFKLLTISTDIIVGHPGETEADFNRTIRLLRTIKPDVVNISKYWPRPGTESSMMEQLERSIIDKRSVKISSIVKKIEMQRNKIWLGWEGEVLIDEINEKGCIARNEYYKPIIIEGKLGEIKQTKIKKIYQTYLRGF